MMKIAMVLSALGAFTLLVCSPWPSAAEEVKLNGAASVVDRLINPHKAEVEKITGYTLLVVSSNAGKGLIDLVEGKCDASLASASVETVSQAAKSAGKEVDISKLQMTVVKNDEVVFIIHPSNPVTKLTWEQVRDIHTGRITNWKDVGGKDASIVVFTDSLASATRGLIKQAVMGGQDYGPEARALDAVKDVNDRVAVTENGIGGLGLGFVDSKAVRVIDTKKVERPLGFITIGPPSDKVRKVIEAFKTEAR
jgi:phosphate transport system substrate-binding protein